MNSFSFKQFICGIYIVTFCIFATNGLGFIGWQAMFTKYQIYAVLLVPLTIVLFFSKRIVGNLLPLSRLLCFLIIMPFISCFSKYFLLGESVFSVMYPIYLSLAFITFFALWSLRIKESTIIIALGVVALITGLIQIWQHVTGIVLFNYFESFYNYTNDEIRNDMLRLYVGSPYIQLVCLLFCVGKLKKKISIFYVAMAAFLCISIYLYLTRQFLVISLVAIFCAFLWKDNTSYPKNRKGNKKLFTILGIVCIYLLSVYWEALFQNFVETTKEDEGFFVRFESIAFFFNHTFSNIFGMLFGFGHSHYEERWTSLGIYAADAGIAGDMYHYGIGWVLAYFYTIRELMFRNRTFIPFYIRLYVLATFINSIFALPYHDYGSAFIWACVLYICSIHMSAKVINSPIFKQ